MLLNKTTAAGLFTTALGHHAWAQVVGETVLQDIKDARVPTKKAPKYYFEKKIENEPQKLKIAKDLYPRMDY